MNRLKIPFLLIILLAIPPFLTLSAATVQTPLLIATLYDRWHEAWQASPWVGDLDGDGITDILVARYHQILGWHLSTPGTPFFRVASSGGRIWSSPIVADLLPSSPGLEVAAASRQYIHAWSSTGTVLPGFPVTWRDEIRSIAAADIDGDGGLELVVASTTTLSANGQKDFISAFEMNGQVVSGYPPNTSGTASCDGNCYVTGGFDQTVALGDVNGDGRADLFVGQDNAYLSLHHGSGRSFPANSIFTGRARFMGIRFLLDYTLAQQGWANNEETALQAHFTNSSPVIADIDQNGQNDLLILGSVQNAAQTNRLLGVTVFALNTDGTRLSDWIVPYRAPDYLAGLWDFDGTNVVGANNSLAVADLLPGTAGLELVFAGFDGRIHALDARKNHLWQYTYTSDARVLSGGVVLADLSADGTLEVVFCSYSPDSGKSHLFILDRNGTQLHKIALPDRGAMPLPTLADCNGNGSLEIVVSLKDGVDRQRQVLVYEVPGSNTDLMPWPTGRGNPLRNGCFSQSTPPPSLTLTSPNGGENWRSGESRAITWENNGYNGLMVIELFRSESNLGVIADGIDASVRIYPWTVGLLKNGQRFSGSNFKIRISKAL